MIGYVTLGTNDMARAGRFYDDLLSVMGAKRTYETDRYIAWGNDPKAPMLFVIKPADGNQATIGNGVMVALAAGSQEQVDAVYNKAISLGAKCEGPAGRGFLCGLLPRLGRQQALRLLHGLRRLKPQRRAERSTF